MIPRAVSSCRKAVISPTVGNQLGHLSSRPSAPMTFHRYGCQPAAARFRTKDPSEVRCRPSRASLCCLFQSCASDFIAPFLTARTNRLGKSPILFCPPGQAMQIACAKPNPKPRLLTIRQTSASGLSANHISLANQPTGSQFSKHIKCRSSIGGCWRAGIRVLVFVAARAVQLLAIAHQSNRVGSYYQLF